MNAKIINLLLFPLLLFALEISVSILPQKGIIKQIAKDKVKINVLVPKGASPATYSPTFKQIKNLTHSSVYFTINVPFEKKFLPKVKTINPNIKIVSFSKFIKTDNNPHIWLSPTLLYLQAKVVLDTLIKYDPKNKDFYLKNYATYINELTNLELKGIKEIKQKAFITFHPSFHYFAKDFGIEEIALQKQGKSPSFKYLSEIIKSAKKKNIKSVIISPEFPTKYAKLIAHKIGAKVFVISPLNQNPQQTINTLIKALK